jgi:hypothetical protein
MRTARLILVTAIAAGYLAATLAHAESAAMAIGLAPIAWLALEGVWRLLGGAIKPSAKNYAESRTGIRLDPKGLAKGP